MEPLASPTAVALVRPTGGLQVELAALLRDGRILAGDVLRDANGGLLLSIDKHTVPFQSDVQLEPGRRHLFQVVRGADGEAALRLLEPAARPEPALLQAMRRVIGEDRPVGELLRDVASALRARLARGGLPGTRSDAALPLSGRAAAAGETPESLARWSEALARLKSHVPLPGTTSGAQLRELFARSGLGYEAALRAASESGAKSGLLQRLQGDLKGELLRLLGELSEGSLREAVTRALAGLEAEQLLNLARSRAGEPLVLSLPFPDSSAQSWTTLRLEVLPRDGRPQGQDGDEEGGTRIALGVSFRHTGPIRIDLFLNERSLVARLVVTNEELAGRLQADAEELARRIGDGRRSVQVSTRVGSPAEAAVEDRPLDIRFLREHHLMDVAG